MPVTKAFSFACLHTTHAITAVTIIEMMAAINRKNSLYNYQRMSVYPIYYHSHI